MKNWLLFFAMAALTLQGVRGNTLLVPQQYPTIQAAIQAALQSDTVLVSEGTYHENIAYRGKSIVVASRYILTRDWQTVVNTVIDGSTCVNKDTASTVMFLQREDSAAVLEGFTITGGTGTKYMFPYGTGSTAYQEGAGIILHYSSAVIKNNIIVGNTVKPVDAVTRNGGGGGIASMYGNPTICNNIIALDTAGYAGGIVLNWSGGRVRNNIVYHNLATGQYGCGGIMAWQVPLNSAFIENNTIVANTSLTTDGGIAISLAGGVIPTIANNIVWANGQATGKQVPLSQYVAYSDIEDYAGGTNFSAPPSLAEGTFVVSDGSPCIDAGDPDPSYRDAEDPGNPGTACLPSKGTLRNDAGAYGGPRAKLLPLSAIYDLILPQTNVTVQCPAGQTIDALIPVRNLSTCPIRIDSIVQTAPAVFALTKNLAGSVLGLFASDTIAVRFAPAAGGTFNDTLAVYHAAAGLANPLILIVRGVALGGSAGVGIEGLHGHTFRLFQNFPNPFNPSTSIRFSLPARTPASLRIYDVLGKEVACLLDATMGAGFHAVEWRPGARVSSGVYFVRLSAGPFAHTAKLLYQK